MNEIHMKLNESGRVVIPAAVRDALGIEPGDELVMKVEDEELRITTLKRRIERAQNRVRMYVKPGTVLSKELIAARREEVKNG